MTQHAKCPACGGPVEVHVWQNITGYMSFSYELDIDKDCECEWTHEQDANFRADAIDNDAEAAGVAQAERDLADGAGPSYAELQEAARALK